MRVLHVIARLNVGGTARYITQLANELPKHGIETLVATGYVQGAEIEDESASNINLARLKSLRRSINPIKDHFANSPTFTPAASNALFPWIFNSVVNT